MKLRRLTMHNFMPYKGDVRIDFPTDEFRNVMLVFGENMRGKTSLLNALRWGFYGRAVSRRSQPIPLQEIPNKDAAAENDWTVEAHIEFEANGHEYDLRRRAEKRAIVAVPQRPDDFHTQVYLKKDGIAVQGDQVEAEINQVSPEQVSRFFLFDGELLQEYETLLIEGSDQGRQIKLAIEQVLGVPALINGRDELATLLKQAQRSQQQDLQRVQGLETLVQRQAELTSRQESLDRDLTDLNGRLDQVHRERTLLDDEIDASHKIFEAKTRLDQLEETRTNTESRRSTLLQDRFDLLSQSWRDLLELKISERLKQLQAERSVISLEMRRQSNLETRVDQVAKLLETNECPTCNQTIDSERREAIGATLGRLESELRAFADKTTTYQKLSTQIDALSGIRGVNARDRVRKIDADVRGIDVELTRIGNEQERLRDELRGYDTAQIARQRVIRDEKVKEEGRLQNEINARTKDIEKVRNDLAMAQRTIDGFAQARSRQSTVKAKLCTELEAVFSQSIERLRDRLRKTVQERATEAFKQMTTQTAYKGLEINGSYGLSIIDQHDERVTTRSAGAEQVVALSLIDGLNRTGRSAGPIVMDTPFGRLDLKHRDNILAYLPTVTSQFVLLVHSGEIRPETDLTVLRSRIGMVYRIKEEGPRHSTIERSTV